MGIGALFGLSVISVFARIGIRIHTYRKLSVDDYFILAALLSLSAITALAYKTCDYLFLGRALERDSSLIFKISSDLFNGLLNVSVQYTQAFIALSWTAIFFVKFSFLAFFKRLIRQVEHIQTYYWIVVAFTVVSWLFVVFQQFILCPYTGTKVGKTFQALDGGII